MQIQWGHLKQGAQTIAVLWPCQERLWKEGEEKYFYFVQIETILRILVLERLYNLSDEQMEYQLLDRMSYKRFCGLANATHIPDRTTVWIFENRIGEAEAKALFDSVSAQLLKKGFIARGGQIIDATLVPLPGSTAVKVRRH